MDGSEAKNLLDLIDLAGQRAEQRRNTASVNRRGEMALVLANAELARQLQSQSGLPELLSLLLQPGNP